jgi:hypothetical protein
MIEYTTMQKLFVQLNVHMKHWFDGHVGRWQIVCASKFEKTQSVVVGGKFVFLSANEATIIDNQFQMLVHVCVM